VNRWISVVLVSVATSIAVCGCATGSSGADAEATSETVGSPPDGRQPVDGQVGRDVSAESVAGVTGRDRPEAEGSSGSSESSEATAERPEDGQQQTVRRDALLKLFERGPGWLLQQVTLEPVRQNEQFAGYRIAGATESARERMAPQLQVGDVVTRVNGVALERPDDYLAAWSKLPRTRQVSVAFRRDGDPKTARWVVIEEKEDG
jgi:hypothetical protein